MNKRIIDIESRCRIYEETLTNLMASTQAMFEVLASNGCICPERDSKLFQKSHVKYVALMDQLFAAAKDQASISS